MAALNFPNSPSLNDTHTENGVTFKWNGAAWDRLGDIGAQGATGSTGAQGSIGPVAGSSSQVVYKDGSNNPAGSSNFTFDGTNLTVGGNVSIGGTLTYEDVTNIDSVGIITARLGIKVPDSQNVFLGTGDDLRLYHDATDSFISHSGPGHLYIKTETDDRDVILQSDNSSGGLANYVKCDGSTGAVELSHYGSLKLSTAAGGVNVAGNINLNSANGYEIRLGTNNDLRLYYDGNSRVRHTGAGDLLLQSNSDVYIQRAADGHQMIIAENDGPVKLYYDNSEKFKTTSGGVEVSSGNLTMQSNGRIFVGNGGNATNPMFANVSDTNTGIAFPAADTMLFTTGGSEALRIKSDGLLDVSGGIQVSENVTPTSGAGLELFREGNGGGQVQAYDRDNNTSLPLILKGSQIQIFANGSEKFKVTSAGYVGIDVTSPTANLDVDGTIQLRASGNTTYATRIYSRLDSTHCSVIESYLNSSTAFEMIGTYADSGGSNPRIAIGAGGQNVGINLTDPAYDLDVAGSIRAKGTGPGAGLLLHTNTGVTASANLMQIWSGQSSGFSFHTNSTGDGSNEVMRLTGAGQLNIGGNYTQTNYRLQVDGGVKGDYFVGESLAHRTGFKWGASGIYYYTLGGSRSGNGASFTMFEVTGMQNSKFVEFQLSFGHSGGGSHGSYRRVAYQSNGYQGLITLEDTGNINYGGGGGFTINKPSNTTIRVTWNGCSSFADGYVFVCEMKSSSSGAAFTNVNSAFS